MSEVCLSNGASDAKVRRCTVPNLSATHGMRDGLTVDLITPSANAQHPVRGILVSNVCLFVHSQSLQAIKIGSGQVRPALINADIARFIPEALSLINKDPCFIALQKDFITNGYPFLGAVDFNVSIASVVSASSYYLR
ncbi:hypothetical protein SAMN06265784_104133 [Paraburkholderia susongensis]|uniref:Uncharacterized protein n=1 Tax=Paraburkholderia susongensis TaxID=1515439 RepID=A0A1X7KQP3_9BURK|nr:hypothetical protein SAMN06265784_104133 [Paraburkholderia susongensis]